MTHKGFLCYNCKKVFFVCVNTIEDMLNSKKEIQKYQKQGYKLVDIAENKVSNLNSWCDCK